MEYDLARMQNRAEGVVGVPLGKELKDLEEDFLLGRALLSEIEQVEEQLGLHDNSMGLGREFEESLKAPWTTNEKLILGNDKQLGEIVDQPASVQIQAGKPRGSARTRKRVWLGKASLGLRNPNFSRGKREGSLLGREDFPKKKKRGVAKDKGVLVTNETALAQEGEDSLALAS